MLALRKRGRGQGPRGGGAPEPRLTGLVAWGRAKQAEMAGGFESLDIFSYPQGIPSPSSILQIAGGTTKLALDTNRKLWVCGSNGAAGGAGQGTRNEYAVDWIPVTGGVPLYQEEEFRDKSTEPLHKQPLGPVGPLLPTLADVRAGRSSWTLAAVAGEGGHSCALTTDGRCLAWGAAAGGALGQGWELHAEGYGAVQDQLEGKWPTRAPWWVMVSGTTGIPDPRGAMAAAKAGLPEANQLTGVVAIAVGKEVTFYLKSNGEIWYSGSPAGSTATYAHTYAAKDLLSDAIYTPGVSPLSQKPIAIVATKGGALALRANGEPVWFGNNFDYAAGDGKAESAKTTTREILVPKMATAGHPPATKVVAIAKGETCLKLLTDDGVVYTAGSNAAYQQGVINPATGEPFAYNEPQPYLVPMTTLNTGGRSVIAIDSAGEGTHGPAPYYLRSPGTNGDDTSLYLLDDFTVRVSGVGWVYNPGGSERWEGVGTTGQGDTANQQLPVEPGSATSLPRLTNIKQIHATVTSLLLLQEPGATAPPSLEASVVVPGTIRVAWRDPPGAAFGGSLPIYNEPTSFRVVLTGTDGTVEGLKYSQTVLNRDGSGNLIREAVFKGVATGGHYDVKVVEERIEEEPQIVGVTTKLSAALSTAANITSLPVPPLAEALALKDGQGRTNTVTLRAGVIVQTFTLAASVYKGATFIPVLSQKPSFAFPTSTKVEVDGTIATATAGKLAVLSYPAPHEPALIWETQHTDTIPYKSATSSTLTAALVKDTIVSALPVTAIGEAYGPGEAIVVRSGANRQTFKTTGVKLAKGATSIPVVPAVANFSYPTTSTVIAEKLEDWKRAEPDLGTNAVLTPRPSADGLTGEEFLVRASGAWPGSYKTRIRQVNNP